MTVTSPNSIITNDDLKWTMGPDYRSTEQYERKLELIGGPSVGMNKSKYKKDSKKE